MKDNEAWWGDFDIPHGNTGAWRLGPLTLYVRRLEGEWVVWHTSDGDPHDKMLDIQIPAPDVTEPESQQTVRFTVSGRSERVRLSPLLADRPVISRPESPMIVPGEEDVTTYVSTPLWVGLGIGSSTEMLAEIPVNRLSNTWFGPSTMEGELCYASMTHFVVDSGRVPRSMHRTITKVRIRNSSKTPLELERLNLPLRHLSLLRMADGHLQTQDVTLIRSEDGSNVQVEFVEHDEKATSTGSEILAEPRESAGGTALVRALGSIFGVRRK